MNSIKHELLDDDLLALRRLWQTEEVFEPIPDLHRYVAHETLVARWGLLVPCAVTIVFGATFAVRAAKSGSPADVSLAAGVWLFIVCAWMGSMWLARGTWRARDETTSSFLNVSIARCDSWIHAVPFAIALYVVALVLQLLWSLRFTDRSLSDVLTSWPMIVIGWLGLPAFVLTLLHGARRKRTQRDYLESLRRQFAES
ncbi:MAG TPA: hypothetical protein VGO41_10265 [Steroidobacteraceae bacterium]|jgi:hypothetical protein|nr:hypothetical protein [Steroidobacteraceae bacterium]